MIGTIASKERCALSIAHDAHQRLSRTNPILRDGLVHLRTRSLVLSSYNRTRTRPRPRPRPRVFGALTPAANQPMIFLKRLAKR